MRQWSMLGVCVLCAFHNTPAFAVNETSTGEPAVFDKIVVGVREHRRAYQLSAEALDMAVKTDREKAGEHMLELARRYQTESKQREIDELTHRNERQAAQLKHRVLEQRWLWTLLGGSLLTLTLTVFFLLRQRRANRLLASANDQLRLRDHALDRVREAAYLIGADAGFVYVNEEACRSLGYSVDELLAMTVMDIDPNWSAERWATTWPELMEKNTITVETEHRRRDGGRFPIEVSASYFEFGGKAYCLSLVRDITERKRAEAALAERERRFRTLAENSPDPIFRYDRHGRRIYVNPAVERLAGKPAEALLNDTPSDARILSATEAEKLVNCIRQVLDRGLPSECELECVGADGVTRHFHSHCVPERGGNGDVEGVLLISRDISGHKRAEAALAARERQFRTLAESLPDNIVRYDPAGRAVYINPVLEKTLGAQAMEMIGRTIREIHPNGEFDDYAQIVGHVLATGRYGELEKVLPGPNGRVHQIRVVAEHDENGAVVGVLAIGRDITEHKRAETALAARERQFRTLAESLPDNIVRYDKAGRTIYVNPALEKTLETRATEMLGATIRERYPDGAFDDYAQIVDEVLTSGENREIEKVLQRPDGRGVVIHQIRVVAEHDPSGAVVGALTIGCDVTALKQAERRLQESHAQLRELAARREAAREEERKHIAREIHDELGQLLTALRMNVSLLRLQFGHNRAELLQHVQGTMELVDKTIQVVRNVASALRPAALDMGIASALEWLSDEFTKHTGLLCRLQLSRECGTIDDRRATALFRIVQEALTNVARYAQAHSVKVTLERCGDEYRLRIRDDGRGFDPGAAATGTFGLQGIKERALLLDGSVEITSKPGAGTLIEARIPIQQAREAS